MADNKPSAQRKCIRTIPFPIKMQSAGLGDTLVLIRAGGTG